MTRRQERDQAVNIAASCLRSSAFYTDIKTDYRRAQRENQKRKTTAAKILSKQRPLMNLFVSTAIGFIKYKECKIRQG